MKIQIKHRRTPAKPRPGPRDPLERLRDWAHEVVRKQGAHLRPHFAIPRGDRVEAIVGEKYVKHLGPAKAAEAASVLLRTLGDANLLALLIPIGITGSDDGAASPTGLARGFGALLVVRSRAGFAYGEIWQCHVVRRHQTAYGRMVVNIESVARVPDFAKPDFRVDPELDDQLARAGFPGARRRDPASEEAHVSGAEQAPEPELEHQPPARIPSHVPSPFCPWESGRENQAELDDVGLGDLGTSPYYTALAEPPVGHDTRPFAELVKNGWSGEAQGMLIMTRIPREADLSHALRLVLAADLPERAKLIACAGAAHDSLRRRDARAMHTASAALIDRIGGAVLREGGVVRWLEREWPEDPSVGDEVGTAGIACLAVSLRWRLDFALGTAEDVPRPADSPLLAALRDTRLVRDWLLDRAGAPPGHPGDRIAALTARVLPDLPSPDGEPRIDRWLGVLWHGTGRRAPAATFRGFAALHAAILHSIVTVRQLWIAHADGDRAPADLAVDLEKLPVAGLTSRALTVVARHAVHTAATAEPERALRLLARARAFAPRDAMILGCHDEARFVAGRHDAELLSDLTKEASGLPPLLAPVAEALSVAESLGDRRVQRIMRRRLLERARGTPHLWIAEVRVLFSRPHELAEIERVRRLEDGRPDATDVPRDRAGRALYGPDAGATIAWCAKALAAAREALEWTALVEEVHAEERAAPPRGKDLVRPEVPRELAEGAILRTIGALRFRLDRPKIARHEVGKGLERHARRATELPVRLDDAGAWPWIESVRDLVAALDLALDGDVAGEAARIEAAVAEAERVLDDALLSRWLEGVYARLAAVWPAAARDAGRGDATLCRRAREVEARAARAATASDRADVDLAVTALAEVARQTPWTDEAGDEGVTDEEAAARGAGAAVEQVDDGFRPMTMDADAARRSLHALDTPDWAVEEGFRQVAFYNLARGRRDLKMLRGTREGDGGALWELRHRDGRNPVRVLYRFEGGAPRVVAVIAKQDDEHQRRMIARVRGLLEPERIEGGAQRT